MACTLAELQDAEYGVLCVMDDLCRENGLHYVLDAGTLLGAIRHHDFIPWDDDIDVAMTYKDYRKLKKLYLRQGNRIRGTYVSDFQTDPYSPIGVAKLRLEGSFMPERVLEKDGFSSDKMDNGVWIDLFLYSPRAKGRFGQKAQDILKSLSLMLHKKYYYRALGADAAREKLGVTHPLFRRVLALGAHMPDGMRVRMIRRMYRWIDILGSERSGQYFSFSEWALKATHVKRALLDDTIPCPFRDRELPVPAGYDAFLTHLYGSNYMTPIRSHDHADLENVILPDAQA